MKSKATISIIIVLIILIGGAAFAFNKATLFPPKTLSEKPIVTPQPTAFIKISKPHEDTSAWETYTDTKIQYSIQYPSMIMLDPRQTVEGRLTVFIFTEDKEKKLAGNVPSLYIADAHATKLDAFSAFKKSDCGKNCATDPEGTAWINLNNLYGIKNPRSNDIANYYLTDKKQSGEVINVYVGGHTDQKNTEIKNKIETFDQMIKTIRFNR